VIPLDASLVRGSHGLAAAEDADRPLWVGDGGRPGAGPVLMTTFRDRLLDELELGDE
jgi:hypothetical protein